MIYAILLLSLPILFITATGFFLSAPKYQGPPTDHFDGRKFLNPKGAKAKELKDVFVWMFQRKRTPWLPKAHPFGEKPVARSEELRITFVNHSTFLIQVDGQNLLTDPVWSERTSPFQFAGPRRMRPPGIRLEDLPAIDAVLLSHNHYDHLDLTTLKRIKDLHVPTFITPLGVGAYLTRYRMSSLGDMDWWDERQLSDSIRIQAVPAQHFSGRGMFDRDATLWCGYVIKARNRTIYFVGDTGYNDSTFKEIGVRCSPIDVAIVPIGAFVPRWFMSPIHCSPDEAVRIHQEVKATVSIAVHFGTFPLADDGPDEPVEHLQKALREAGVSTEEFLVLEEGKPRTF